MGKGKRGSKRASDRMTTSINVYKKPLIIFLTAFVVFVCMAVMLRLSQPMSSQSLEADTVADFNSGKIDDAISKAESVVAEDNQNIQALLLLATSYAEKGNQSFDEENYGQKAIDTANKVLEIDPRNSQAYNIIGYAYEIMQKYDDARINYDKAIGLDPKNAQAYSNKGHSYDLQGDLDAASELYDKALSIDPNNEHALLNSARIAMRKDDKISAEKLLNTLVEKGKNARMKAVAFQLLALIESRYNKEGFEKTLEYLNKSIELDPELPQAYTLLAETYVNNIQSVKSGEEFKTFINNAKDAANKALSINPNQTSALHVLSRVAFIEGDMDSYRKYKQQALDVMPNDITLGAKEKEELKNILSMTISDIVIHPSN